MDKTPFPNLETDSDSVPGSDPERESPEGPMFSAGREFPGPVPTRVTPELLVLDENRTLMITYFEPSRRVRFALLRGSSPECLGETVLSRPLTGREELHALALQLAREIEEHPGEPGKLQSW